jgi:hypothetical protein
MISLATKVVVGSAILDAQMCKGCFEAGGELGDIFRPKKDITAPKRRSDYFGHRARSLVVDD